MVAMRLIVASLVLISGCSAPPMVVDAGVDSGPDAWVWDPDAGCLGESQTLTCTSESVSDVPSQTSGGPAVLRTTQSYARVWLCPGSWQVVQCSPTRSSTTADGEVTSSTTDDCETRSTPGGDTLIVCSETRRYEVAGELRWEHATTWGEVRVDGDGQP